MRNAFLPTPLLAAMMLATSCVPAATPPRPAPAAAVPRPLPAPAPAPLAADWRDWPLTPGTWRYTGTAARSSATFGSSGGTGAATLTLACDPATAAVTLSRTGAATSATSALTIRTTTVSRVLPASGHDIRLAARDPLLDAMVFSRGRFLVEQAGTATLVLPAWAEIGRVVEDCRR